LYKNVSIKRFLSDGAVFTSGGKKISLQGFDSVVIAEKMTPIRNASELFKNTHIPVHLIGDAKSPRILMHAISEAEDIGRAI
jgi:hypothetical protein